ncbi:MAG: hypothetical protein AB7T06_09230 [Kofleriaceae bacterium]
MVAATVLSACGTDGVGGEVLEHRFPSLTVPAGGELNFVCQSWTLHNDTPLHVNATEVNGGPGWHHTNWLFAGEDDFAGPDGTWRCEDRGFELVSAGISGGVLFAPSPELESARQEFAPGVAIVIPARAKIIAEVHLINPSDAELVTSTHLAIDALPASEVHTELSPLAISNYALDLPAASSSTFSTSCDLESVQGGELAFSLYTVEPHYHDLGEAMRVEALDAGGGLRMVHEARGRIGNNNLGGVLVTPFDMRGSTGLRMSCDYRNSRERRVGFGPSADAEMCVMFAFTDSPYKWIAGSLPDSELRPVEGAADRASFASECKVTSL